MAHPTGGPAACCLRGEAGALLHAWCGGRCGDAWACAQQHAACTALSCMPQLWERAAGAVEGLRAAVWAAPGVHGQVEGDVWIGCLTPDLIQAPPGCGQGHDEWPLAHRSGKWLV